MPHIIALVEPAESIARLGFARWYERRLIESHAWLVTAFVCMIAIAACLEELGSRGSWARSLAYMFVVALTVLVGLYGFMRYQKMLIEAERLGERATCQACGVYARFSMISDSQVQCRKCSHEWRLID